MGLIKSTKMYGYQFNDAYWSLDYLTVNLQTMQASVQLSAWPNEQAKKVEKASAGQSTALVIDLAAVLSDVVTACDLKGAIYRHLHRHADFRDAVPVIEEAVNG